MMVAAFEREAVPKAANINTARFLKGNNRMLTIRSLALEKAVVNESAGNCLMAAASFFRLPQGSSGNWNAQSCYPVSSMTTVSRNPRDE